MTERVTKLVRGKCAIPVYGFTCDVVSDGSAFVDLIPNREKSELCARIHTHRCNSERIVDHQWLHDPRRAEILRWK